MAGFCEHNDEYVGTIEMGFLYQLSTCQLLKEGNVKMDLNGTGDEDVKQTEMAFVFWLWGTFGFYNRKFLAELDTYKLLKKFVPLCYRVVT
jgi:hypothetical protein